MKSPSSKILIRLDDRTRTRLDAAVATHDDVFGMQAAICRAAIRLYCTLTEGDLEAAEAQIKRITHRTLELRKAVPPQDSHLDALLEELCRPSKLQMLDL